MAAVKGEFKEVLLGILAHTLEKLTHFGCPRASAGRDTGRTQDPFREHLAIHWEGEMLTNMNT